MDKEIDLSCKPDYIFFIATYGTTPGQTGRFADHILAPKGLPLSAKFSVKMPDTCVGCGLCAKNCPVSDIKFKDRKPEWMKEQCVMCLSCLHHCPKFAIQYGKNTKKHGQYVHSLDL